MGGLPPYTPSGPLGPSEIIGPVWSAEVRPIEICYGPMAVDCHKLPSY